MARLTTTKYYELKINLYSLANKLINELDFETTKKIKDFIKLIGKLQEEDERKEENETDREIAEKRVNDERR